MRYILLLFVCLALSAHRAEAQNTVPPKPPVGVPMDAKSFNGKWYRVYKEKLGWKRAKERCTSLGGQLAVVPDEATHGFIRQLAGGLALWLGATDEKLEGAWEWVDGTPMTFKAWQEGEPQSAMTREDYLCMWTTGQWRDAPEQSDPRIVGFVCEWKAR